MCRERSRSGSSPWSSPTVMLRSGPGRAAAWVVQRGQLSSSALRALQEQTALGCPAGATRAVLGELSCALQLFLLRYPFISGYCLQPFWFRSASISPLPHLCPENRRRHSDFFVLNLFPCLPTASLQPSAQAARVCRAGCGRVRSLSRVWLGPAGGGGFGAGLRAHGCERPGRARGSADYTSHGALRQVGGYLLPHWSAAPPLCAGIGRRLRALRVPQRGRGRKCGVRRPRWLRGVGVGAARPAM